MYDLLNLGSLLFGILAWVLPLVNLIQSNKQEGKRWAVFSLLSITACATSICFQIVYNYHLVQIEDWGALEDTMYAVTFCSIVLLLVTLILNVLALNEYHKRFRVIRKKS